MEVNGLQAEGQVHNMVVQGSHSWVKKSLLHWKDRDMQEVSLVKAGGDKFGRFNAQLLDFKEDIHSFEMQNKTHSRMVISSSHM